MSLTGSIQGVMRFIQNHTEADLTRVHEHFRGSINRDALVYTFWVHNLTLVVGDIARWKRAHFCEDIPDAIISN
jgi:hypothetical protein